MKNSQTKLIISVLFAILITLSCKKQIEYKAVEQIKGIVFSIDDGYIDLWYEYLDYCDSLNVKLTIYVSGYHDFTEEQKIKLHKFQKRGHEIAYHSTNHIRLFDFLKNHTINDYLNQEILPDLKLLKQDGFTINNFAYPYGESTTEMDTKLLTMFKSVRKLAWSTNTVKIWSLSDIYYQFPINSKLLYAAGIDRYYTLTTYDIIEALKIANKENKIVFLYCHRIGDTNEDFELPTDRFKKIIDYCYKNNFNFYTVNELINNNVH